MRSLKTTSGHSEMTSQFVTQHSETTYQKLIWESCQRICQLLEVVVVVMPQLVCPSKPAPLRKSKQLAGECHRCSGLLMLCCALMCVSAGQWVIICVGYGC